MKSTPNLVVLVLVAASAALAHATPSHVQVSHRPAINPQPLPPRHGGASVNDVINPQPLPPRTIDMTSPGTTPRTDVRETDRN